MQRILHRSDVALRETHWNVIRAVQRIFANPERSTAQFVAAGERLARIAEWLETLADPDELRKLIAPPRPVPAWLVSQYPSRPSDLLRILLLRRRRSRCRATEDAPRRISRGRAPPFVQTCSL